MPKKIFGAALPQIWGAKTSNFGLIFATSTLDIAYLLKETSHRQAKMLVSIYNVSPKTFHDLLPRNG